MNPKFVVSHLDQQLGPFSEQELKAKWSKGELFPIDYVYDEAKKDWILLAERFDWAAGRSDGAPPPLKPISALKKTPPAPVAAAPVAPTPNMAQQKPVEETLIIHAPVLNLPAAPSAPAVDDPMPTPTTIPVMHNTPVKRAQPAKVNLVNGVGEIDLSSEAPGQVEVVLQDLSGGNLKMQGPLKIQVRPLEPEEISWSLSSQPVVGHDLEITVKAVDGKGTLCTHFSAEASIRVAGSEPRTVSVFLTGGQATVKIANTKAEKWDLSFQYSGSRPLRLPETKSVDWQPGPAARLILDGPPELVAGNPLKVQVRAVDQYGNLARTFQGTVVLEVKAS
jgi:hypothetical protein